MFVCVGQVFLSLSLVVAVTAFCGNSCFITDKPNSHSKCSLLKSLAVLSLERSNMCFCFRTPYRIDTLSSLGAARVFSGLHTNSGTLFGHSVTWIKSKRVFSASADFPLNCSLFLLRHYLQTFHYSWQLKIIQYNLLQITWFLWQHEWRNEYCSCSFHDFLCYLVSRVALQLLMQFLISQRFSA